MIPELEGPDTGVCGACRQEKRIKRDGTMVAHWTEQASRRRGYPACEGTSTEPVELNAGRVAYAIADKLREAGDQSFDRLKAACDELIKAGRFHAAWLLTAYRPGPTVNRYTGEWQEPIFKASWNT